MKPIVMYRRTLDVRSGVGQLMHWQAIGLRAAGARIRLACRRGSLRYFVRTGWLAQRLSSRGVEALGARTSELVIDHELELPRAALVFAHGLISEAVRLQPRPDWTGLLDRERRFFRAMSPAVPIVTCSALMKAALIEHYAVDADRVHVHYPGYRADAFDARRRDVLRTEARRKLGLDNETPLIGFVTSGDFLTRGIDTFLAAAERIRAEQPAAKFLVVGSKRLPESARAHALVAAGHVLHRPKSGRPELWMSALDIFLYPSRFDAFGIVISEAQALGIPVLTSRRAGAAECLPDDYGPWLIDAPDAEAFAAHALRLLADDETRRALAAASVAHVRQFSRERYVSDCVATILAQNV